MNSFTYYWKYSKYLLLLFIFIVELSDFMCRLITQSVGEFFFTIFLLKNYSWIFLIGVNVRGDWGFIHVQSLVFGDGENKLKFTVYASTLEKSWYIRHHFSIFSWNFFPFCFLFFFLLPLPPCLPSHTHISSSHGRWIPAIYYISPLRLLSFGFWQLSLVNKFYFRNFYSPSRLFFLYFPLLSTFLHFFGTSC